MDAQGWLQPTIQSATPVGLTYEFGMVSMGNFHPLIPTPTPNPSYILAAGMLPLGMHSLYMCVYAAYVDNLAPIIPGIEPPVHTTRQCAVRYVSVTHPAPVCMRNNVSECIVANASRLLTSMGAWVELAAADWLAPEGAALKYAFGVVVRPTSNPITSVPVVTPTSETFPPEISLTPSPTADPVDILNGESETTVPQTQATETFMVLHGPDYSPTYTFSLTAVGLGAGMHVLRVCAYAVDPASIPAGNASASGLVLPSHPACADSVVEVMPEPVEPITEEAPDTGSLPRE